MGGWEVGGGGRGGSKNAQSIGATVRNPDP